MLKTNDGYEIYEVKFPKNPMTKEDCTMEAEKIAKIDDLNILKIGFISSSGFAFESNKWTLISGDELY